MILKDVGDFHEYHASIITLDDLIYQLQGKGFNYRHVHRCRHLFPRWGLQTILLKRVLYILHFIETPNCTEQELRSSIEYLVDPTNILPDIWSWASKRETMVSALHKLVSSKSDISQNELLKEQNIWHVDDCTYENIAHSAVHDDNFLLTKLLCSSTDCPQLMQTNRLHQTVCHIAVVEWKLNHLSLLVNCCHFDLSILDKNGRSVLTLLLYTSADRIRRGQKMEFHFVVHIVQSMFSGQHNLQDIVLATDVCGQSALGYALATHNAQVIHTILMVYKPIQSADLSMCLHQAILLDNAATVDALVRYHLHCNAIMNSSSISGQYEAHLSSHLCFAISHYRSRALLTLLSHKEFLSSLNSPHTTHFRQPQFIGRQMAGRTYTRQYPLHVAIDNIKYFNNADCLRVLIKFGVNVLLRLQDRYEVTSNRHAVMTTPKQHTKVAPPPSSMIYGKSLSGGCNLEGQGGVGGDRRAVCWGNILKDVDYASSNAHDNIFSYAASLSVSSGSSAGIADVESAAIDALRYLIRCKPDAICYLSTSYRRVQADEAPFIPPPPPPGADANQTLPTDTVDTTASAIVRSVRGSLSDTGGTLDFFLDYALLSCSPLVSAILSAQSTRNTQPTARGLPYHQHSSEAVNTPNNYGCRILEYLLIHSPFKALIDAQEIVSGLTPLAAACATGNVHLVNILLMHGARVDMKINACISSTCCLMVYRNVFPYSTSMF